MGPRRVAKTGPGGGGEERKEEGRGEGQGGGVGCWLRVGPVLFQVWAGFHLFWPQRRPAASPHSRAQEQGLRPWLGGDSVGSVGSSGSQE